MTDLNKIRAAQVRAAEQAAIADLPPELLASVAPAIPAPEGGPELTATELAEMWLRACADWNDQAGTHPDPWEHFATRLAAALAAQPQAIDVERLIRECLPGGHSCDPQAVADTIREWARAQQTKEPTNDR